MQSACNVLYPLRLSGCRPVGCCLFPLRFGESCAVRDDPGFATGSPRLTAPCSRRCFERKRSSGCPCSRNSAVALARFWGAPRGDYSICPFAASARPRVALRAGDPIVPDRPYPETFAKPCASRTSPDPGLALWNCQLPHAYGVRDRGVRCDQCPGESSRTGPAEADHIGRQACAIEQDLLSILTRTGIATRRRRRRRSTRSNVAGWARRRRCQMCLELSAPAQRGYGRTGRRRRNA